MCKSCVVFLEVKEDGFNVAVCAGELAMYCEESSFLCGQKQTKIANHVWSVREHTHNSITFDTSPLSNTYAHTVEKDPRPQWRKLVWSEDDSLVAMGTRCHLLFY